MIYLFSTPFGPITYDWDGVVCREIELKEEPLSKDEMALPSHDDPVSAWLESYFRGQVKALPSLQQAATHFQQAMREALLKIPAGKVRTYGEIAAALRSSPRGLGQALKANPLPILIPCHRIVAANGLGGFTGGLIWKKRLLRVEGFL